VLESGMFSAQLLPGALLLSLLGWTVLFSTVADRIDSSVICWSVFGGVFAGVVALWCAILLSISPAELSEHEVELFRVSGLCWDLDQCVYCL
jgi:hypothetical protein